MDPNPERDDLIDFLFTYQVPDAEQIAAMQAVRAAAKVLAFAIDRNCQPCADRTDAIRKLMECVNTVNRGITLRGKSYR